MNKEVDIVLINDWIDAFNARNGKSHAPRFHLWGTHTDTVIAPNEECPEVRKAHRWKEWRQSEQRPEMMLLNDRMRIKMGKKAIMYLEI